MHWRQFRNFLFTIWPVLNNEDQHRLSWAKRIKSYDTVPDIYKFFFEPFPKEERAFPYTILTPTFEGFLHPPTTEKLVCALDHEIYVLERVADAVKIHGYPLAEISCIEVRIVLLASQITICGTTKDGLPTSISIKFNTATEELFTPILEKIRRTAISPGDREPSSETEQLERLGKLNFKFMNYARRSLLEGEEILQIILQPRIQARVFKFLGKTFYRVIAPAHLSILTDQELILIREEDNKKSLAEYGKVYHYIQLKKIVNLSLEEEGSEFSKLSVQLPEGVWIENLYQTPAKKEVNQLLSQFASMTPSS